MGFLHGFHWAVQAVAGIRGPLGGCAVLALLGALAAVLFLPSHPDREYWNHS